MITTIGALGVFGTNIITGWVGRFFTCIRVVGTKLSTQRVG